MMYDIGLLFRDHVSYIIHPISYIFTHGQHQSTE